MTTPLLLLNIEMTYDNVMTREQRVIDLYTLLSLQFYTCMHIICVLLLILFLALRS